MRLGRVRYLVVTSRYIGRYTNIETKTKKTTLEDGQRPNEIWVQNG